jgi:hypothetical protein
MRWQHIVMKEVVQMASLDIDSAIGAHKAWKGRLEHVILGIASNNLNRESVCDDSQCLLGLWLYGRGKSHSHWTHFDQLVRTHKVFHRAAGQIVASFHENRIDEAQALLDGEFQNASDEVVDMLTQLREHLAKSPER